MKHRSLLVLFLFFAQNISYAQSRIVRTFYFELNSYTLNKKYVSEIKNLAKIANTDSCTLIRIIGYADTTGSHKRNDILSRKRAYSVFKALLYFEDISLKKFKIDWNGDSEEWYDLHFKGAHIMERCVDVSFQFNK